jgi:transcription elongation factor Elf1
MKIEKCPECGAVDDFINGAIDINEHGEYQHCHACGRWIQIEKYGMMTK